jgi:hypothetical protein
MPLDGSGGYTLPPVYNVNGSLDILPEQVVQPFEDISDALSLAFYRDGRAPMTGDLPMGGSKITGLLAGVAATDAVTVAQASALANASRQNRIVNGAMRISQERGTALVDVTTLSTYTVDQWQALLSTTPGGTLRCQQIASITPAGSPNRLRMTAQATDASIAVGDLYSIQQPIEGVNVVDARFGAVGASQIVLRLGVRSSIAGTFGVSIANSALTRSWVGTITIGAGEINTDLVRTFAIPGDTAGTWLTDTGIGLRVRICLAAGTDWHGVAGWQGSNEYTTSAQTNFMGTGGATFELFDVGLYVDALNTGTTLPFEVPLLDEENRRCRRYWEAGSNERHVIPAPAATFISTYPVSFKDVKRATPAIGTNYTFTFNIGSLSTVQIDVAKFVHLGAALTSTNCEAIFDWTANARF